MLATNTKNYNSNKDQYKFQDCNYNQLKENISPPTLAQSTKTNEKQPDFSLYSKYLRPNYTSKKKKVFEEPAPKIPSADVVNISSLGIGPEMLVFFCYLI